MLVLKLRRQYTISSTVYICVSDSADKHSFVTRLHIVPMTTTTQRGYKKLHYLTQQLHKSTFMYKLVELCSNFMKKKRKVSREQSREHDHQYIFSTLPLCSLSSISRDLLQVEICNMKFPKWSPCSRAKCSWNLAFLLQNRHNITIHVNKSRLTFTSTNRHITYIICKIDGIFQFALLS